MLLSSKSPVTLREAFRAFRSPPSASAPGALLDAGRARILASDKAPRATIKTSEFRRMPDRLTDEERAALMAEALRLREEHRDLDAAIDALELVGKSDQLQIQRLKKRKLFLRDRLAFLDDTLTPDIIA
jgi:hypothetical protein